MIELRCFDAAHAHLLSVTCNVGDPTDGPLLADVHTLHLTWDLDMHDDEDYEEAYGSNTLWMGL